jgi:hypothetical protein
MENSFCLPLSAMTPLLDTYKGISISFYSNEHDPIHVHGYYQGRMMGMKAEIHIKEGKVQKIIFKNITKKPLPARQKRDFETYINKNADSIIENWINYHILHKPIIKRKNK